MAQKKRRRTQAAQPTESEWIAHARAQLTAIDDQPGLERLSKLLPEVKPEPWMIGLGKVKGLGEPREVRLRTLCAADVLDWVQRRTDELQQLAELRPALSLPGNNDAEHRARWRALAEHAPRFAKGILTVREKLREARGSNRRSRDGSETALPYPPVLQWLEALADATRALLPQARVLGIDRLDRVVALKRDLTTVLSGQAIAIEQAIEAVARVVEIAEIAPTGEGASRVPREGAILDVVNDPDCKTLRDILRNGPKLLRAIGKDTRSPARRKVSSLLAAMNTRGMVEQTKNRGAWRFVSDVPTK